MYRLRVWDALEDSTRFVDRRNGRGSRGVLRHHALVRIISEHFLDEVEESLVLGLYRDFGVLRPISRIATGKSFKRYVGTGYLNLVCLFN